MSAVAHCGRRTDIATNRISTCSSAKSHTLLLKTFDDCLSPTHSTSSDLAIMASDAETVGEQLETVTANLATSTFAEPLHVKPLDHPDGKGCVEPSAATMWIVFTTTELIEDILDHLPLQDLLMVQAICRHFKEVFTASVKLRRKLHLADLPTAKDALINLLPTGITVVTSAACKVYVGIDVRDLPNTPGSLLTGRSVHQSWESMTPIQPAVHMVALRLICPDYERRTIRSTNKHGFTLGELYCAVRAASEEHKREGCRFALCRNGKIRMGYCFVRC